MKYIYIYNEISIYNEYIYIYIMRILLGEAGTNSSVMYSYGPPHMAEQKQDDQLEHTYKQLCEDTGCSPEDLPEAMY